MGSSCRSPCTFRLYISFGSSGQLGKGLRNSLLVSVSGDGAWEELILDCHCIRDINCAYIYIYIIASLVSFECWH